MAFMKVNNRDLFREMYLLKKLHGSRTVTEFLRLQRSLELKHGNIN